MNARVLASLVSLIKRDVDVGQAKNVKLFKWIRHLLSVAGTDAVYGPANPMSTRPELGLEQAFWDFDDDFKMLLLDVLPSITARKGHQARNIFANAFKEYFNNGGAEQASYIIKERLRVAQKYQLSIERFSRWDIGMHLAILVNAVPTCFWLAAHVLSDAELLADLRKEIAPLLKISEVSDDAPRTITMDITRFTQDCPLFISTFQEVLRTAGGLTSAKAVIEDTLIGHGYLLKKGAIVLIPGKVIHNDPAIWGADAREFDPRRFLGVRHAESRYAGAFRTFGGGATMCPGRHFARTELISFVAVLITAFDVNPAGGTWILPEKEVGLGISVLKPLSDMEVELRYREGFEDIRWRFETGLKKAI